MIGRMRVIGGRRGLWVAVGADGKIATSRDGLTWTQRTSGVTATLTHVAGGLGRLIAVDGTLVGGTRLSTDRGSTWGAGGAVGQGNLVGFGNGEFVAPTTLGSVFWSTTGSSWAARTSLTNGSVTSFRSHRYLDGYHILTCDSRIAFSDNNGSTWTDVDYSGSGTTTVYDVAWNGSLFIVTGTIGGGFVVATTTDFLTLTGRTTPFTGPAFELAHGNGITVATGQKICTSTDGTTWTERLTGVNVENIDYGNGLFVATGVNGAMYTSPDGITWTSRTSSFGTSNILSVRFFPRL